MVSLEANARGRAQACTSWNEEEPGDTSTVSPLRGACTRALTAARSFAHAPRSFSVSFGEVQQCVHLEVAGTDCYGLAGMMNQGKFLQLNVLSPPGCQECGCGVVQTVPNPTHKSAVTWWLPVSKLSLGWSPQEELEGVHLGAGCTWGEPAARMRCRGATWHSSRRMDCPSLRPS